MTELKCPFCNKKLDNEDLLCGCINEYCEESFDMVGTQMIWQKVIDTKKKLDIARSAFRYIADGNLGISPAMDFAEKALDQINQKESK